MITCNGQMWSIIVDPNTKVFLIQLFFLFFFYIIIFLKQILTSKIVDSSSGLLSGIGRRFTSFMLGGTTGKNGPVSRFNFFSSIYCFNVFVLEL